MDRSPAAPRDPRGEGGGPRRCFSITGPTTRPPGQSCCRYCGNRLPLLSLNTSRGNVASGKNSVAVLPGREADARTALDEAITVAADTKAAHVMAGFATGPDAEVCFRANH